MNQRQKFALGGGGFCNYAPTHPSYQHSPGFADDVQLFTAKWKQLFVLSLVDNRASVTLRCERVELDHGAAVLTYTDGKGLSVTERRFVTGDDRFVSQLTLELEGKAERNLTIVQWTTTDLEGEPPSLEGDMFRVRRAIQSDGMPAVPLEILWSNPDSKGSRCLQAFASEAASDRPDFEETPWFEMGEFPVPRAKRVMQKPSPILPGARVYLGLFRPVQLKPGQKVEHRFEAYVMFRGKGINYRPRKPDVKDENGWLAFFDKAPKLVSESKAIERIFRHRLEMMHLLRIPSGVMHLSSPSICEGNGRFHAPSAFVAPAIMREARWLNEPTLARGVIKVFFENLRQSGMVPGRVYMTAVEGNDFYHADWGAGFAAIDAAHPDRATKRAVIMGMQRYVKFLANNRDPEGSGLTDICNHFESGQEFSRRYTVIDEKADKAEGFAEQFRLKGIDTSVFRYRLVKHLSEVADELQEKAMANRFLAEVETVHDAIKKRMWDEKAGIFMDLDPVTRRRTGVKAAVGFYPLGTDVPTPAMVDAMLDTLTDRNEFWTKFPIPSLSASDPYFNAHGLWKGTRRGAPWNGRVWPMINSHVLEALCRHAERGHKRAQKVTKDLFERMVAMLSGELEGIEAPRTFEHYSPLTGLPCRHRGVDWYLGSFMLENIMRIACGIAIRAGEVILDPVIDDMPDFKLTNLVIANKRYLVERRNGKTKVVQD
jgi:hypothetical protein